MPSIADLDEAWLQEARQRAAAGQWERAPGTVFDALRSAPRAEHQRAASTGVLACPACPGRPRLEPYRRHGWLAADPLWLCETCHGAWLTAGALAAGFSSREHFPPAVFPPAERQCPTCQATYSPPGPCPACTPPPHRTCPACDVPMEHLALAGVELDTCPRCRGTWFDLGELAHVYALDGAGPALPNPQSRPRFLAPHPWFVALELALDVVLPRLLGRR